MLKRRGESLINQAIFRVYGAVARASNAQFLLSRIMAVYVQQNMHFKIVKRVIANVCRYKKDAERL